jgi:Right handed beta helix region
VRTLGRLIAGLRGGQVGCVEPGMQFREHVTVASGGDPGKPARIRGAGAVLKGLVRIGPDGHDLVLENLQVRGDGSAVDAIVSIAGPRITLSNVSVDGPNFHNANVACVRLHGRANGVVLRRLVAHNCTRANRTNVYAPGIVVGSARNTRIVDSIVYHSFGDGIVLAPNAHGTRITRTIVDGNTSGIYIAGNSSGNVISNSIISFSGRYGVHGDGGRNNVVAGNCIWGWNAAKVAGRGFRAYGNLNASPRYLRRAPFFEMRPGPCSSKVTALRAAPAPQPKAKPKPRPRPKPKPKPKPPVHLPRFTVHYTLRALPSRVQVVGLTFTGLARGATLHVRCTRQCKLSEQLRADPNGTATSAALLGRWLPRGSVLVVTERRGRSRAVATIRVTGLPKGFRIAHT